MIGSQLFGPAGLPGDAEGSPWLARARSNLQIMYRTALAVSHTLDIDQLLARIMDLIFEWVDAIAACVMLVDHETGELAPPPAAAARAAKQATNGDQSHDSRLCARAKRRRADQRRQRRRAVEFGRFDRVARVREAICVPMQGRYGIVGVIYIDTFTAPGVSLPTRPPGTTVNKFSEEHSS